MDDGTVIRTTVTSSAYDVRLFLQEFQPDHGLIVGLDVEWRPNFQRGGRANKVATLQLCVGRRCLVYQIIHSGVISAALGDFLENPRNRFVGVGIADDAQKLLDDYGLQVTNTLDLRNIAAEEMWWRPELQRAGLKDLALVVMGVSVDKPQRVRLSNWDAWTLTSNQVKYATMDAFLSYEIARRLLSMNNYNSRYVS